MVILKAKRDGKDYEDLVLGFDSHIITGLKIRLKCVPSLKFNENLELIYTKLYNTLTSIHLDYTGMFYFPHFITECLRTAPASNINEITLRGDSHGTWDIDDLAEFLLRHRTSLVKVHLEDENIPAARLLKLLNPEKISSLRIHSKLAWDIDATAIANLSKLTPRLKTLKLSVNTTDNSKYRCTECSMYCPPCDVIEESSELACDLHGVTSAREEFIQREMLRSLQ